MAAIPRDPAFDSTLGFLREGYNFIAKRCDALGSDGFQTRFLLQKAICLRGAAAAEMFYSGGHFTRKGAVPQITKRLLQDRGSVQELEGSAHTHRKQMFLDLLLDPIEVQRLVDQFTTEWHHVAATWPGRDITFFDEVRLIIARAVSAWVGIPRQDAEEAELNRSVSAMVENATNFGPGGWHALWLRSRTEKRIRAIIREVRDGRLNPPEDAPLRMVAEHRDELGNLLDLSSAAVEVLNLLRPVVAIGRFMMFAAMALHEHPEWQRRFAAGEEAELEDFAEEVRRFYPFFAYIAGRAVHDFEWQGHIFEKGAWVILDLYGTNHDPQRFPQPASFAPGRGISWSQQGHDFIPQGAGNAAHTHRCPGEMVTVELLKQCVRLLAREMRFEVPAQDLTLDLTKVPPRPASGFLMRNARMEPAPVTAA